MVCAILVLTGNKSRMVPSPASVEAPTCVTTAIGSGLQWSIDTYNTDSRYVTWYQINTMHAVIDKGAVTMPNS